MHTGNSHHISVKKTARFHTLGNTTSPKTVWVVLHGYGQLSTYFIQKFCGLDPDENLIIAPEGLHRFYKNGNSGRVGASWMTKEERQEDISDYVYYLDQVAEKYKTLNARMIILGFSQGAATASRWVTLGSVQFDHLVLWSSVFPPDLELKMSLEKVNNKCTMVFSDDDEFYAESDFLHQFSLLKKSGYIFDTLKFEGKHDIDKEALLKLASRFKKT